MTAPAHIPAASTPDARTPSASTPASSTPASSTGPGRDGSRRGLLPHRRRWDKQPTQPAAVLIASAGDPIPAAAVSRSVALSAGQPVAVISLARIYGSALGLPNPGLLPSQRELAGQRQQVADALAALQRAGLEGWGQVAATRRPGRTIARVARARGVRHVILVTPSQPRWRRFVEGNLVREISRKLAPGTSVEAVIVLRPG